MKPSHHAISATSFLLRTIEIINQTELNRRSNQITREIFSIRRK
jgi:hypothetical protein